MNSKNQVADDNGILKKIRSWTLNFRIIFLNANDRIFDLTFESSSVTEREAQAKLPEPKSFRTSLIGEV